MNLTITVSFDPTSLTVLKNGVTALQALVQIGQAEIEVLQTIAPTIEALAVIANAQQSSLVGIEAALTSIEKEIVTPPPPPPVSIHLALPSITKNGKIMANFELANDEIATIPILVDDAAGQPVPAPAGDVFSVTSSSASLGVAIGATASGAPAIVLTPMVQASPGITVTVTDSAGLSSFAQLVDIVQDQTPKAITLDIADATEVSQPVPTAPGP